MVSTLGAVAGHRPGDIANAIKQTDDGVFEVTLNEIRPATPKDPIARPTGDTVTYKINDELPVRTDQANRPPAGVQVDGCGWPALLEKTVAAQDQTWSKQQEDEWAQRWQNYNKPAVDRERLSHGLPESPDDAPKGYNRIDIGSTPHERADLLAQLTGCEAEVRTMPDGPGSEKKVLDEFRDLLAENKPILVGSRGRVSASEVAPLSSRVFAFAHAYEVSKVEGGKIHLSNPWGEKRNPPPMDVSTFLEYYRQYNQNGSRTGYYATLR
jgi:hypothetical protein